MPLTPDAKKLLAETIRGTAQDPDKGVRARLLRAIHDEADRRYRLSVPIERAELDEASRRRRERIEAWIDERARAAKPKNKTELKATKDRLLAQAEKEAAATLVNRLVLVRQLEALGLSKPQVLSGGWSSKGYREFREFAPTLCTNGTTDGTEGYATLLQFLFDELAVDLPGLFGDVGLTRLFPIPAATLRDVVERLDDPELASAWTDDTTLGWVYQYWNDPDREALDAKINDGGKIEPHEIASKTQMFTERYMVEWLLQNSLGLTWLAMCKKRGWTADAERVLPALDERRAEWRKKREAGEVALDALMPIAGELEEHWKYYVPQPVPDDAVEKAPESVRAIKVLDPACGSGHFLVIAFDLLAALYREEAKHQGVTVSDKEVAQSIVENNLHGIDIDPRAIQIAAAALYLKAKGLSKDAHPRRLNLVAPVLQLGNLPADDPAVVTLKKDLKSDVGIPEELTTKLLSALAGVDYLGSLLKVDAAVDDAIKAVELEFERKPGQGDLFGSFPAQQVKLSVGDARATVLDRVEQFLAKHSKSGDLGLRLDGEQVAAGVRFVRIAKQDEYDVVVGNPPYLDLSKRAEGLNYLDTRFPKAKFNLYSCFVAWSLALVRSHSGIVAFVTMRGWMFQKQFAAMRAELLETRALRALADLGVGAFSEIGGVVVSATLAVFARTAWRGDELIALDASSTPSGAASKAAALRSGSPHECSPDLLLRVPEAPLVHWWTEQELREYVAAPKLGDEAPVRTGLCTSNIVRFIRYWWELKSGDSAWAPLVSGAKSMAWMDPCDLRTRWNDNGLEMKVFNELLYGSYSRTIQNEVYYFRRGIAYTTMGHAFAARAYRVPAIFEKKGSSVFPSTSIGRVLCAMNASRAKATVQALNPGTDFQVGDVNRLPLIEVGDAEEIFQEIESAFDAHEQARETSVQFRLPAPSAWLSAQEWAQRAVDSFDAASKPRHEPIYDAPSPALHVSFALGMTLGRFVSTGDGVLSTAPHAAVPHGVLFVCCEGADSIEHPSSAAIVHAWNEHGFAVAGGDDLRTYLRKSFFEFHKKLCLVSRICGRASRARVGRRARGTARSRRVRRFGSRRPCVS